MRRRDFAKWGVGLLGAVTCGRGAWAQTPTSSKPSGGSAGGNQVFLREQAQRVIDSALLRAGRIAGPHHNTTPYDMHVPGGNMGYPAFWVRDAVMMLGGDFIAAAEIEGWIKLMCSVLRGPEDWQVRPGVVVPAYCVPDHINFDGKATFYPGNYESGDKQGGPPWGKYPPLDDNFYFLAAVYEHWRLAGDLRLFKSPVRTSFSEERLCDVCEKVYRQPPCDKTTGLVTAGDVEKENAKDWGFCDGVFKSGKLLFPSILKLIAARQLGELFTAAREAGKAADYRQEVKRISAALPEVFLRPSKDDDEAWLHSATGVGNQPDVWGSALAVHSRALDGSASRKVSKALVRAFREKTAVKDGCVRQILTNDTTNNGGWEKSISKVGTYQNGGYWGTPVGWYISAMFKSDRAAAAEMAGDYVRFLQRGLREDGMTEAWEWWNDKDRANPLYVASVALPYLSLKAAGILKVLDEARK